MRRVAVVGAGKIGSTVVDLLVSSGAYEALVIDQSAEALAELGGRSGIATAAMAIDDSEALAARIAAARAALPRALDLPAPDIVASPLGADIVSIGAVAAAVDAARTHALDLLAFAHPDDRARA